MSHLHNYVDLWCQHWCFAQSINFYGRDSFKQLFSVSKFLCRTSGEQIYFFSLFVIWRLWWKYSRGIFYKLCMWCKETFRMKHWPSSEKLRNNRIFKSRNIEASKIVCLLYQSNSISASFRFSCVEVDLRDYYRMKTTTSAKNAEYSREGISTVKTLFDLTKFC